MKKVNVKHQDLCSFVLGPVQIHPDNQGSTVDTF